MDVLAVGMLIAGIVGFTTGFSSGYIIRDAIEKIRQKK